jgi:curved DNA-binding protein CbpA
MLRKCIQSCQAFLSSFDANKDYYKILHLTNKASKDDIKVSFRKLAKLYHPDANKGNDEKFKEVNEAYQVLSSEETKRNYDSCRQSNDGPWEQTSKSNPTHNHESTYRGYHQEQGWQSRKYREEFMNDVYQNQQNQHYQQHHYRQYYSNVNTEDID